MTPLRSVVSAMFACMLSGSVAAVTAHAQEEGSTPGAIPDPSTYQGSMEQQRQSDAQDQQFRQDEQEAAQERQQNYDYAEQATQQQQQRSAPSRQSYAPSGQREVQSSARPAQPSSDPATAAYERVDYASAARLVRTKALNGDPNAEVKLGYLYEKGLGVARDPATAASWYRKSADQGYAEAQAALGRMYFQGLGVQRDPVEGYKWLIIGGRESAAARRYLQAARQSITYDQMSEATRRAQLWTPVRVAAPAPVTHAAKNAQGNPGH